MQEIVLKIVSIIIIFVLILSIFPINSFSGWADDAKTFLSKADQTATVDENKLASASNEVYGMLSSVGMVASVIVGIILGIKYMMASVEEKANVKESLTPYFIGCIVVFGAFGIWKLVITTFSGLY